MKLFDDYIKICTDSTSFDLHMSLNRLCDWAKTWQMDITFTKMVITPFLPKYYIWIGIYFHVLTLLVCIQIRLLHSVIIVTLFVLRLMMSQLNCVQLPW